MNIIFTGHRPNRLYGYDLNDYRYELLVNKVDEIIKRNDWLKDGNNFYTGGALGFDTIAFKLIEKYKEEGYNVKNILCIPFEQQYKKFCKRDQQFYHEYILPRADEIIYVDSLEDYSCDKVNIGEYHIDKMRNRNQFMVDNCDAGVISCWNKVVKSSGTFDCIKRARKVDKLIINITPKTLGVKLITK